LAVGLYKIVISQQIKEVTANGHEELNRFIAGETPWLLPAKNYFKWLIRVEDIVCYISVVFRQSVL